MSIFTEPGLKLNFIETSGREAELLEEIRYELGREKSGRWLIVPIGFRTDGATVPRPLWWFLPPWGSKTSKAAIIHDYLLWRLHRGDPVPGYATRSMIDDEFLIAMRVLKVSIGEATLVWLGVRGFGIFKAGIRSLGLQ